MKTTLPLPAIFSFLLTFFAAAFPSFAQYSIEDISPHFSTNLSIVWQAPTNHLPKGFWIYKKTPRVFSATTISNAVLLAGFQEKGFPKPSKSRMLIWADHPDSEPMPPNFAILPDEGQISFSLGDRGPDSPEQVWTNQAAIDRAWDCLSQLHIDQAQFVKKNAAPAGTWGVFFPRHIEGFPLYDQSQGFSFQQFGKEGKIRCFDLMFPNLQRQQFEATASAQQIIACIRKFKTPSPPEGNEPNYFARIKNLAKARKVTIIGIIPFYAEGRFGEHLKEQEI